MKQTSSGCQQASFRVHPLPVSTLTPDPAASTDGRAADIMKQASNGCQQANSHVNPSPLCRLHRRPGRGHHEAAQDRPHQVLAPWRAGGEARGLRAHRVPGRNRGGGAGGEPAQGG